MNCFHGQRDENAQVCFHYNWFSNKSILNEKWTSIIKAYSFENRVRSDSLKGKLSQHLRLRLDGVSSASHALTNNGAHNLSRVDYMKTSTESSEYESSSTVQKTLVFRSDEKFNERVFPMENDRMKFGI